MAHQDHDKCEEIMCLSFNALGSQMTNMNLCVIFFCCTFVKYTLALLILCEEMLCFFCFFFLSLKKPIKFGSSCNIHENFDFSIIFRDICGTALDFWTGANVGGRH